MDELSLEERIKGFIVARIPQGNRQQVRYDDLLLEKGLLDSLGVLDVVTFLEKEFRTVIDDEELTPENFMSIRTIANFVKSKQSHV